MFNKTTVAVLGALVFLGAFVGAANADHSWGGYHWARTANPFALSLGDNLSSAWDPYLVSSSGDWSASSVLDTSVVPGTALRHKSKSASLDCSPVAGTVQVCNKTYGKKGWLGIASVWVSSGHITKGTVKMNDTYFNTAKYNTPAWRNLVMCQEVGHTIGLDHQDENFSNVPLGTCMDYSSDPAPNQHPNAHDYEQLNIIYSHFDSTTTVGQTTPSGQMPPAMADIDFETPAQWGKLIRSSHSGRTEVYELDFGGGHKVFTFVIWAEGEARGRR